MCMVGRTWQNVCVCVCEAVRVGIYVSVLGLSLQMSGSVMDVSVHGGKDCVVCYDVRGCSARDSEPWPWPGSQKLGVWPSC